MNIDFDEFVPTYKIPPFGKFYNYFYISSEP